MLSNRADQRLAEALVIELFLAMAGETSPPPAPHPRRRKPVRPKQPAAVPSERPAEPTEKSPTAHSDGS